MTTEEQTFVTAEPTKTVGARPRSGGSLPEVDIASFPHAAVVQLVSGDPVERDAEQNVFIFSHSLTNFGSPTAIPTKYQQIRKLSYLSSKKTVLKFLSDRPVFPKFTFHICLLSFPPALHIFLYFH